jgi:(1->4)-alpha-D-glucan 1-alpha-D-glucosylmutase
VSTYRLQCNAAFDLTAARRLIPYLADLGVDWLYLSPVFTARPGSGHGYDVVDPTEVNPELGGSAALDALAADAQRAGIRILLDIVPNHQAVTTRNPRWCELLHDGPSGPSASWFDIDWSGNDVVEEGKVCWGLLGRELGEEIAVGSLHVEVTSDETTRLRYHDEVLPVVGASDGELRDVLSCQHYQLMSWRSARHVLNYRRFFDVSELIGVRVEDVAVFEQSHALVFDLVRNGVVDGLRVDHIDGLAYPDRYLARLADAVPDVPVFVEKILGRDEPLPAWPIVGTTGYETTASITDVLIDPDGRTRLERALLAENDGMTFAAVEADAKRQVLRELFVPEWRRVRAALGEAAVAANCASDDDALATALAEVTVALDVYRTYCAPDPGPSDRERIERAVARVRSRGTADPQALHEIGTLLLGDGLDPVAAPARAALVTRWQQTTGAVMAKGHEDTAEYRYPALLAQAEVGDDPASLAADAPARFHAQQVDRARRGRAGMTATATHDSKRGEDVRARLAVLTERADAFEAGLARWRDAVAPQPDPAPYVTRFVAQTLLGAWPLHDAELPEFGDRVAAYLVKARREAKDATSWLEPDERHEAAVVDLARRSVANGGRIMHETFGQLLEDVAWFGAVNGLAQLTWKLGAPGTADIYRGCESWDLSLVDPDNRRAVDFDARRTMLQQRSDDWRSGAMKLHMTAAGLRARREHRHLFRDGDYVALHVVGDPVLAFARRNEGRWAIACAPRLPTRLAAREHLPVGVEVWHDLALPLPPDAPRTWQNVYTDGGVTTSGDALLLAGVLDRLPAALLVST